MSNTPRIDAIDGTLSIQSPSTLTNFDLPTTDIAAGHTVTVINDGTDDLQVRSSGTNNIRLLNPDTDSRFVALQDSPTTAAHWRALGKVQTEWLPYTPQNTINNMPTDNGYGMYRRDGNTIEYKVIWELSGAVGGDVTVDADSYLPSNVTVDTSVLDGASIVPHPIYAEGVWYAHDATSGSGSDQHVGITGLSTSGKLNPIVPGNDVMDANLPFPWANGDTFTVQGTLPILEWAE